MGSLVNILVFLSICVCSVCLSDGSVIDDPCNTTTLLPALEKRSVNNSLTNSSGSICDQRLPLDEGWYLPRDGLGRYYDIAEECVGWAVCTTMYPLYLNGSIPAVEDGVVNMLACQVGPDERCGECYSYVSVKIKNCGDYRVYYLPQATGCPQAYCFDLVDPSQKDMSTPSPTPDPTTATPVFTRGPTTPNPVLTQAPTTATPVQTRGPKTTPEPPQTPAHETTGGDLDRSTKEHDPHDNRKHGNAGAFHPMDNRDWSIMVAVALCLLIGAVIVFIGVYIYKRRMDARINPPLYDDVIKETSPYHPYDCVKPVCVINNAFDIPKDEVYEEIPEKADNMKNDEINDNTKRESEI